MWDFCDLSLLPAYHAAWPSWCVLSLALSTRPLLILHRLQTQSLLLFFLFKASPIVQFTGMKKHCFGVGFRSFNILLPFAILGLHFAAFWLTLFFFYNFTLVVEFLSHLLCLLFWCGRKDGSPIWIFPVPGHLPLVMELPLAVTEQASYSPPSSLLQSHFWLLIPPSSASVLDLSFLWTNNNTTYLPLRGVVKIN